MAESKEGAESKKDAESKEDADYELVRKALEDAGVCMNKAFENMSRAVGHPKFANIVARLSTIEYNAQWMKKEIKRLQVDLANTPPEAPGGPKPKGM